MSVLEPAISHHIWATLRLLDACGRLDPDQLDTAAAGTYGSIVDTLRHLVEADAAYLELLSGGTTPRVEADDMTVAELGAVMAGHAPGWASVVEAAVDPDAMVVRHRDDGSESHAPLGIRLAQVLHHGSDHRSQVCTALTTLGIEPPAIDVWDYAADEGIMFERTPE
jgi:uncharacterized damage-inducible protein DinB